MSMTPAAPTTRPGDSPPAPTTPAMPATPIVSPPGNPLPESTAAESDVARREAGGAAARKRGVGIRLVHLWAVIPLVIAWYVHSTDTIEPFDFWWNVKSGQIMAEAGRFLSTDVLVWTPVRLPYYNPQWGSQLLFFWLYDASPYVLLTARAAIITATVALVLWLCLYRSNSLRAASIATLVAYFTGWTNYGMRPQLFAFLPFAAFLLLLERKDTHARFLPLLTPIMLFWVNVHGSFFLGAGLLGIYALGTLLEKAQTPEGRRWLRTRSALWQALCFLSAGLVTLANPYVQNIYNYFFVATNDPVARSLNIEWQAPTLYDGTGILFYANAAIFLATLYASKRRLRPTEILLVLVFGYLSLTSLRNVLWWGLVTAPMLAANLAEIGRRVGERRARTEEKRRDRTGEAHSPEAPKRVELPAVNAIIAALMIGGALAFTPLWRPDNPLVAPGSVLAVAESTPLNMAAFLKANKPPTPLFNYMEWGGYLEWELYPRYLMFIDGRFEARQIDVWKDYINISRARADWPAMLDRYGIRTLVLNKEFHRDLIRFVQSDPHWHKAYTDSMGVVFTR